MREASLAVATIIVSLLREVLEVVVILVMLPNVWYMGNSNVLNDV